MNIRMLENIINRKLTLEAAVKFYIDTMVGAMKKEVENDNTAIQECAVTGFMVCCYFKKSVEYIMADRQNQYTKAQWNSSRDPFPFLSENEILRCNATGDLAHEMIIVRQNNDIALFQSFVDRFYLFPALNERNTNYNVVGQGAGAEQAIRTKLSALRGVGPNYYTYNIPLP